MPERTAAEALGLLEDSGQVELAENQTDNSDRDRLHQPGTRVAGGRGQTRTADGAEVVLVADLPAANPYETAESPRCLTTPEPALLNAGH